MNIYLKVFFDTFLSYFSLGLYKENLYFISLKFKNNIFSFSIISFLGFLSAIILNYYIGYYIQKISLKKQEENSFIHFLKNFFLPIVFFSTFNGFISQIFSTIYGFLNKKFYTFASIAIIGRIVFIFYVIF